LKVFYSWQLDSPRRTNRDLIRAAAERAISALNEEIALDDAERQVDEITLDQDTQGILGSPPIAKVIFDKIKSCDVFLADVSLVASGADGRKHINSNVAIELGYALGSRGFGPVLKVMNTALGQPSELPFDLRERRFPVQYELPDGADKVRVERATVELAKKLKSILGEYHAQRPRADESVVHSETLFTDQRARFWNDDDILVPANGRYQAEPLRISKRALFYFRCIPKATLPELSSKDTEICAADVPPLSSITGYSRSRNYWGAIVFDRGYSGNSVTGATQIFRNREIWAFDPYYASVSREDCDLGFPIVPTGAVKREYPRIIQQIRDALPKIGYIGEYVIEFGLSNASGVHLAIDRRHFESYPGPLFQDEIFVRKVVSESTPTTEIFNDLMRKLFDEAGRDVPTEVLMN
jgi:hypothetical protein